MVTNGGSLQGWAHTLLGGTQKGRSSQKRAGKSERRDQMPQRCQCLDTKDRYRCRKCGRLLPDAIPESNPEDRIFNAIFPKSERGD